MRRIFDPIFIKIYLLAGGVGALLSALYLDNEALFNAGYAVTYYLNIVSWVVGITHLAVFVCAVSPLTVTTVVSRTYAIFPFLNALPAGEQPETLAAGIHIGEDILIRFDSPSETKEEFGKKGFTAMQLPKRKVWVLGIPKGERFGMLLKGMIEYPIDRAKLPWKRAEDWTEVNANYQTETWEHYEADLAEIAQGYLSWVVGAKTEHAKEGEKASAYYETFFRAACLAFFLLLSANVSAQVKSEQVLSFLGERRANLKPVGPVVFRFAELEINRDGDGQKTLINLLAAGRGFSNADNAGMLAGISISINGKMVALTPMPQVAPRKAEKFEPQMPTGNSREEIKRFVRPNKDTTARAEIAPTPMDWARDSVGMSAKINDTKEKLTGLVIPLWNGVMIGVDAFFYGILYLLGISRFASIICNNETRINAWGQRVYGGWMADIGAAANALTFSIAFVVAIIALTNIYLNLLMGSFSGLLSAFFTEKALFAYGWVVILWAAAWAFDKWVPNPKVINRGGNFPARRD